MSNLPGMLYAAFLRSNVAHARIRSIDVAAARAREGVVAVYTAEDLGDYWAPGPLLVPPPPITGHHLQSAHPGAARQGQGAARRRAAGCGAGAKPLPRRGCACRHRRRSRAAARGRRSGKGADAKTSARVHDDVRANVAAHVRQTRGNYAAARAGAAHVISPPLSLRSRRVVADRDPRHCRQLGRPRQSADHLGHHPGAGVSAQRACRHARLERAAGTGDRSFCRRRLRPENHAVLSRRRW